MLAAAAAAAADADDDVFTPGVNSHRTLWAKRIRPSVRASVTAGVSADRSQTQSLSRFVAATVRATVVRLLWVSSTDARVDLLTTYTTDVIHDYCIT